MGRTNLIILCFGIFACVALSLMMGHAVKLKDKTDVHPAIFELHKIFGDDLKRRPILEIEDRDERKVAVLTIDPRRIESSGRLSPAVGRYFLRLRGPDLRFDELQVVARDKNGKKTVYPIRVTSGMNLLNRRFDSAPRKRDKGREQPAKRGTAPKAPDRRGKAVPVPKPPTNSSRPPK